MRFLFRFILAVICTFNNARLFAVEKPVSKFPEYELLVAKLTEGRVKSAKSLSDLLDSSWFTEKDKELKDEVKGLSFKMSDFKISRTGRIISMSSTKGTDHFDLEFINSRQGHYLLNGYFADFSKLKSLSERLKYIERILKNTKTSQVDFRRFIWQTIIGTEAQAVGPLVLAILIAGAAGWGTAGYEICHYRISGICTPKEEKINDALSGIKKLVDNGANGTDIEVKLTCNGDKGFLSALDSNGDSILRRPQVLNLLPSIHPHFMPTNVVLLILHCVRRSRKPILLNRTQAKFPLKGIAL